MRLSAAIPVDAFEQVLDWTINPSVGYEIVVRGVGGCQEHHAALGQLALQRRAECNLPRGQDALQLHIPASRGVGIGADEESRPVALDPARECIELPIKCI